MADSDDGFFAFLRRLNLSAESNIISMSTGADIIKVKQMTGWNKMGLI